MAITSARSIVNVKDKGHFEHNDDRVDKYTLADELPTKISELRLRPRSMAQKAKNDGFIIRKLTAADKEKVLDVLKQFFFHDEPMNQAVQLLENEDSRCIELEEYAAQTLDEEVSVAAVDERGYFVGLCINGIVNRQDAEEFVDKSDGCPNPKFKRILKVLTHLEREAKIWQTLPRDCDKVMEVRICSTHTAWRGRGLMRALCEESERIAKAAGAGAMRMDATSAFSAAAAERLHYKNVYKVRFADVPDAPVPEPPHVEARVYIKMLQ